MTTVEEDNTSSVDASKVRRFAIGVALVMLVYVGAGGKQIGDDIKIETLKITLSNSHILLFILPTVSLYASIRYWWYAIKVPTTRRKIREYLQHTRSLLVIKNWESVFRSDIQMNSTSAYLPCLRELETKVPPGMRPDHFMVFTDANKNPDDNYMFHLCRNRVDTFYPGIGAREFQIDFNDGHFAWVSPLRLQPTTRQLVYMENLDLWLPIILNVVGLLFFLFYIGLQEPVPRSMVSMQLAQ